jgi:hypothetical protein
MQGISENQLIVKSNKLIEASYNLNLQETRIVLILASLIKKDDESFRRVILKVKDFIGFLGITDGNAYKKLQKITDSLGDKSVIIKEIDPVTNKKTRTKIQWLSSSIYHEGDGIVELEFSENIKPFLLKLKTDFTKYQLKYVLRLTSAYHVRLYECARQWSKLQYGIKLSIDELRERLGIPENKYKLYADLKKRVLVPGQLKIKEDTDVVLNMEEIKQSRKITGIFFTVERQINENYNEPSLPPPAELVTDAALLTLLTDYYCLSHKDALHLITKFPESQIKENLEYVNHRLNLGKVDSVGPYTKIAIQDNYKLQLSLFDVEKHEELKNKRKIELKEEKEADLKIRYKGYRIDEIKKYKDKLSNKELEEIKKACEDKVEAEKGKKSKAIKKMQISRDIDNYIVAQAGILDFEEWKENRKND